MANEKIKSYCIACGKETNQEIVCSHFEKYDGEEGRPDEGLWSRQSWDTLKCLGCDAVSFRETSTTSEDYDYEGQKWDSGVRLYPQPDNNSLPIKPYLNVPRQIEEIYAETIKTYNIKAPILCTAGIRTILEAICLSKNIKDGPVFDKEGKRTEKRSSSLEGKIEGMLEKGLLTPEHKNILHEHRVFGNDAVHELKALRLDEAKMAIEIIEHTLDHVFEIPSKANQLRQIKTRRDKAQS